MQIDSYIKYVIGEFSHKLTWNVMKNVLKKCLSEF